MGRLIHNEIFQPFIDRPQAGGYNIHEIGLDAFLAFSTCRLTCGGVRRRAVRVADTSRDDH